MLDGGGDVIDLRAVLQRHPAGAVIGSTEDGLAHLMHAGLGQSAEAEDLALVELEADIFNESRNGNVLALQHHLIGNGLPVVCTIIVTGDLTANHEPLQVILRDVLALHGVNVNTVPENRDGIGLLQYLRQIVGNENDGIAAFPDPVHVLVELLTTLL